MAGPDERQTDVFAAEAVMLADERVPEGARGVLEGRLERDAALREAVDEQRAVQAVLTRVEPPQVAPQRWERVWAGVERRCRREVVRRRLGRWLAVPLAVAASVAVMVGVGVVSRPAGIRGGLHIARAGESEILSLEVSGESVTPLWLQPSADAAPIVWFMEAGSGGDASSG